MIVVKKSEFLHIPSLANAFYDPNFTNFVAISLGAISGNSLATIDILGHEYTHAIIDETANLGNTREPGALGESFCDIFGTVLEHYIETGTSDYLLGEDASTRRSLEDPPMFNHPEIYQSSLWRAATVAEGCITPNPANYPTGNDNCGIHHNCGVQNKWFYLLTKGAGKMA